MIPLKENEVINMDIQEKSMLIFVSDCTMPSSLIVARWYTKTKMLPFSNALAQQTKELALSKKQRHYKGTCKKDLKRFFVNL